ncbi:small-conductance mechanosensitive channel [Deinococcus budaensis]|uniref:Small-conductance mechanosensitive channel n=1 Tax=Deinococcus budaensis TaxID=1665626 RepID=A0A7W8GFH2_9DEIO|nr:hypothetical protein [Deinococcus budaensis]MBB5234692.1 small-conductance mechanosensitive channel [Deinococcus budaensis]
MSAWPTDPAWRPLYRVGAACAALYVLLLLIPLVLLGVAPQPPLSGGTAMLDYIAAHKAVYLTEFVSFVGLSVPAMVVFLALTVALWPLNRSFAALGGLIGIASEIVALAYNSSPPSLNGGLLLLSDQFVATTDPARRSALATAAEGLMAVSNAVNAAGILTALGIGLISLPMLRGIFPRRVAWLGIVTGAVGLVCEALRDLIGAWYLVYGLLLPLWFLAVGWRLSRLGMTQDAARSTAHSTLGGQR